MEMKDDRMLIEAWPIHDSYLKSLCDRVPEGSCSFAKVLL